MLNFLTQDMVIEKLADYPEWALAIARLHFAQWGPLTGHATEAEYIKLLEESARLAGLPQTLMAHDRGQLLGSVNLVRCDLDLRPELTPWLAQLFVVPEARSRGVGAALVRAAEESARDQGFLTLYLYTSGTLPDYYRRFGWELFETIEYLGRVRTIMQRRLA